MNKTQEKDQLEVLVAVGIGLAFVGWLISAHLAGWLGAVGSAFGRFAAFVNGVARVAVWLIPGRWDRPGGVPGAAAVVPAPGLRGAGEAAEPRGRAATDPPHLASWACWRIAWKMPVGVTSEKVLEQRTAVEQALDCSLCACWYERGLVRAEFGVARLPQRLTWRSRTCSSAGRRAPGSRRCSGASRGLARHRFEAPEDGEPAEVAKRGARCDRLAGESGPENLALSPGQDLGGRLSLAALADVARAGRRLIMRILPSHGWRNLYSHDISSNPEGYRRLPVHPRHRHEARNRAAGRHRARAVAVPG